jgi:hypothetical protein
MFNVPSFFGFRSSSSGGGIDPDAQAFLTATGITNPTEVSALNQLVSDLKTNNLWSNMYAIYPVLGGTATTHKYNLKDAQDLNSAYRLTFSSGWSHSSLGMTPNGSAYADTHLIPSSVQTAYNTAYGYYSRSNIQGTEIDLGATTNLDEPNSRVALHSKWSDANAYYDQYSQSASNGRLTFSMSGIDTLGLMTMTRTANNDQRGFVKGIQRGFSSVVANTALPSRSLWIGAYNVSSFAYGSSKQCAFAFASDGLNATQATTLDTIVQDYQTTLGREV